LFVNADLSGAISSWPRAKIVNVGQRLRASLISSGELGGWAAGQMGFWWGWLEHGLEGTFRYRSSVILLLCC